MMIVHRNYANVRHDIQRFAIQRLAQKCFYHIINISITMCALSLF